ncbi:aminopeptidase P family protein [Phototrophicus methaneseepsis]|uniref:Aminopeptidase P family protein n=1 Tax=Phototrophicus methaneseepsis TaxID=2710758 RepID=A0A7S8E6A6_9CHLR|nr:Xaa-Pro peptidase family protein [Phototrophicus methaneseepsis]QPC81172.1 aminopeptidase P family protein [Phototrophicus methaneseepsis]
MVVQTFQLKIADSEFAERKEKLRAYVEEMGVSGIILFDSDYILYFTGFKFIPTERPIAFAMTSQGNSGLYVPRLEFEHARANALIDRVDYYKEYPDKTHPAQGLLNMLSDMGLNDTVLADHDGYPWIFGYRGPALTESGYTVKSPRAFIEDQMAIKSEAEIRLLQESARWGNLAHQLLQRYTVVGATETVVEQRASNEATLAMMDAIGPIYRAQNTNGAFAGYRGQIGRNASIPHALANNITFQKGDVLVTGATAGVWGYVSELERTMFLGNPTDEQKRLFDHMLALQDLAIAAIEPGKPCSAVDTEVRQYFADHDLTEYWKHHSGHTIGIRYHEGPFLDVGDDTIIQPGMVFTVEPGLYAPGIGGFRHSDTVVVREDGVAFITYYPRDLDSLILPA